MSYFGGSGSGGGAGWGPPPTHNFFSQPPPPIPVPIPIPFFPPNVQTDYVQQGYNQYVPTSVPEQPQYPLTYEPQQSLMSAPQKLPSHQSEILEKDQIRREYSPPRSRYSPVSRGRKHLDDRHSPERNRSRRDDDDYSQRNRRSPSDDRVQRRLGRDDRGRPRDRTSPSRGSPPPHQSASEKPKVDINALLQDERLRNVLFAGISKATAKLEQSLQEGKDTREHSDFDTNDEKSQLFPAASSYGSQKPRSILKRNKDKDSGDSKTLSNLSALEKTLQLLRGKGDLPTSSMSDSPSADHNPPSKGALGQLSAYGEANDEDSYLYGKKEHQETPKAAASSHPFWSVPSKLETSKKETDSFDMKEKMFEEWRQSIGKQTDSKRSQPEKARHVESPVDTRPSLKKRETYGEGDGDNQEELDSTVQNILQSIGFNFDLSRRMQELSRIKKQGEGNSILNTSASFMDKGEMIAEELKSSLLQSGADLSGIETLIKEARASSQGNRPSSRMVRSPSSGHRGSSYGRDVRDSSLSSRHERDEREDDRSQSQARYKNIDQWERVSPEEYSVQQRGSPPRRSFRDRRSLSPVSPSAGSGRRLGPGISERFRDDDDRNEYFYPDKEFADAPPSVPLLTSFSSRKTNEDLSSGLLKSMRVENFLVMSKQGNDPDDVESQGEVRRIILPAKSERRDTSSHDVSIRTVMRKRSASPIAEPLAKERKFSPNLGANQYVDYSRGSPGRSPNRRYRDRSPESSSYSNRRVGSRDRSLSPKRSAIEVCRPIERRKTYRSRSRERPRERSRSPYRRRSRSRSPYRPKSPLRRRSPSPIRRRRSPVRRSPFIGRYRISQKKGGRSKSRERSKQQGNSSSKNRKPDTSSVKNKPGKDLSKMSEQERRAELQKMTSKAGTGKETKEIKSDDKPDKDTKWQKIVVAMDGLVPDISLISRTELILKAKALSTADQTKTIATIGARTAKVLSLKLDLEKLQKAQNELMRKNQRKGLGIKDPQLTANSLAQLDIEKEIDRLSALELNVELNSNFDQSLLSLQTKLVKSSDSSVSTPKAKTPKADTKSSKQASSAPSTATGKESSSTPATATGKESSSKPSTEETAKADAVGSTLDESKTKANWTSVAVKEGEALPEIKGNQKSSGSSSKDAEKRDQSAAKSRLRGNIYYEYIDSGNHWCRNCYVTCSALDQYFNHCHSRKHFQTLKSTPKVWQKSKEEPLKSTRRVGQAQTRRIKGSEMMVPIAGFYCSLCQTFCGDYKEGEAHLKSDSHYDKYLDHVKDNPGYEKKLLLEKSKSKKDRKQNEIAKRRDARSSSEPSPPLPPTPPPPPSLPPPGEKKAKKAKSHFRSKTVEEEKESGEYDDIEAVDMDLDEEEDERNDDVDVESKVPKLTSKSSTSVTTLLSSLPESGAGNTGVAMKLNPEEEVKSLDTFLTIAIDEEEVSSQKASKLPVIIAQPELDVSSIPIPEPAKLSGSLNAIPLPSDAGDNITHTAKTLKEVQNEEQRIIDEEKKMMGIDVDADEEKPLAPTKRPPPLLPTVSNVRSNETSGILKEAVPKPKSLDNLFAKVSAIAMTNQKVKSARQTSFAEPSTYEEKIQQEIKEKLKKEKEKLLKQQENKERRLQMLEEKKMEKRKVYSESSSEEETTESEDEEEVKASPGLGMKEQKPQGGSEIVNAPSAATAAANEFLLGQQCGSENDMSWTDFETGGDMELKGDIKVELEGQESVKVTIPSMKLEEEGGGQKSVEMTFPSTIDGTAQGEHSSQVELLKDEQNIDNASNINIKVETETPKLDECQNVASKACKKEEEKDTEETSLVKSGVDEPQGHNVNVAQATKKDSIDNLKQEDNASASLLQTSKNDKEDVNQLNASQSCNVAPKNPVVKTAKKGVKRPPVNKTAVKALQSQSDIIGVLSSSPNVVKKGCAVKGATPKRGGKAKRVPKKAPPVVPVEEEDMDFFMEDFVVLSEVTEEEEAGDTPQHVAPSQEVEATDEQEERKEKASKDEEENVLLENINTVIENLAPSTKVDATATVEQVDEAVVLSNVKLDASLDASPTVSSCHQKEEGSGFEALNASGNVEVEMKTVESTVAIENTSLGSVGRGRGRGKRVVPKKEKITTPVIPSSDDSGCAIVEAGDVQGTGEATADLEDPAKAVEEEAAPVVGRTRRSARAAAAAKNLPVKMTPERQTRSRGKRNAATTECQDSKEDVVKSINESEKKNEPVTCDDAVTIPDTIPDVERLTPATVHPEEKAIDEEGMPTLQPECTDGDADSDATITEDVDDNPDTFAELEASCASTESASHQASGGMHQVTSQPRDPPMSGVVIEVEPSDTMVVLPRLQEEQANGSEFESLPTAGLSLDLEEDTASMDFDMVQVDTTEAHDSS